MRSVNMVQIDMTGNWCGGSINALTADSCPAAGDDFLKVVKSLALIPHGHPSLPNLVPVQESNDLVAIAKPECTVFAQAIAEPEYTVFAQQSGVEVCDMSATDSDEDWTVCGGVLSATATTDACLHSSLSFQQPCYVLCSDSPEHSRPAELQGYRDSG